MFCNHKQDKLKIKGLKIKIGHLHNLYEIIVPLEYEKLTEYMLNALLTLYMTQLKHHDKIWN